MSYAEMTALEVREGCKAAIEALKQVRGDTKRLEQLHALAAKIFVISGKTPIYVSVEDFSLFGSFLKGP